MGDDKDSGERVAGNETLAESIARETGITEDQARELIRLIGTDRIPCSVRRGCCSANAWVRLCKTHSQAPSAIRSSSVAGWQSWL